MAVEVRDYSLSLPSEPKVLSVARAFVEAVAQACFLEKSVTHALVMAAGEAVTNIIRHAHRDLPALPFHLHVQVTTDAVVLTFRDHGEPFDIAQVPHMNPGELRIGGRGVFMMRTLMDEVTCEPRIP